MSSDTGEYTLGPFFRHKTLVNLKYFLYDKTLQILKEKLDKVVAINREDQGITTPANLIITDGRIHSEPGAKLWSHKCKLLPKYKDEVIQLIDEIDCVLLEKRQVDHYLTGALNLCVTLGDLYIALPEALHEKFDLDFKVKNKVTSCNSDLIKTFYKTNERFAEIVASRVFLNIVIG